MRNRKIEAPWGSAPCLTPKSATGLGRKADFPWLPALTPHLWRVKFNYSIIHLIYTRKNNEGAGKMNLLAGWQETTWCRSATFLSRCRFPVSSRWFSCHERWCWCHGHNWQRTAWFFSLWHISKASTWKCCRTTVLSEIKLMDFFLDRLYQAVFTFMN